MPLAQAKASLLTSPFRGGLAFRRFGLAFALPVRDCGSCGQSRELVAMQGADG